MTSRFIGKVCVCDGCGFTKEIVYVTEFGGGFCEDGMKEGD